MTYHRNYCAKCDWSASTENYGKQEVASLAIEHFQETQHTIESEDIPELDQISID